MKYKIIGGTVLLMQNNLFVPVETDLYVADGKIAKVGALPSDEGYEKVDSKGLLIIPGLVNMHTHAYMSFMRGYADDLSFDDWLFPPLRPAAVNASEGVVGRLGDVDFRRKQKPHPRRHDGSHLAREEEAHVGEAFQKVDGCVERPPLVDLTVPS